MLSIPGFELWYGSTSRSPDLKKVLRLYFCDQFDVECDSERVSLGGWIMEQMGRIPKQGDHFTYRNLCITVTKLDDHRIESAQIKVLEPEAVEET